jgi:hypothetical protein
MNEATERIVWEVSARGIAQQQATLDGLRGRSGLLIGAASVGAVAGKVVPIDAERRSA